jgi:hypothetical protein
MTCILTFTSDGATLQGGAITEKVRVPAGYGGAGLGGSQPALANELTLARHAFERITRSTIVMSFFFSESDT